jgi:hypothetical protein
LNRLDIPLRLFWQALITQPKREQVKEQLVQIFTCPPSFKAFQAAINARSGRTAGWSSELTYNMVQAWPEVLSRAVYDLLVQMWTNKHIPEWWRWRWLIPIPKKPATPTIDELRPIMLI